MDTGNCLLIDSCSFVMYFFVILIIIIQPLFTLGSVYSTSASGAKQTIETNNCNIKPNKRIEFLVVVNNE